jgi:hypothetical protein
MNPTKAVRANRAVVFTHFSELKYREGPKDFGQLQNEYRPKYKQLFRSYLLCPEIALVYVYVDWSFKQATPSIQGKQKFEPDPALLVQEQEITDFLELTERQARSEARLEDPASGAGSPRFIYVGILRLLGLLNSLVEVNPQFTQYFCGPGQEFTYDSPKFVEAVIRLARGDTPHLAAYPVIRIDEDAEPNPEMVRELLRHYGEISRSERFYIFSGAYGRPVASPPGDSQDPTQPIDYLNDFAVRTHFFAKVGPQDGYSLPPDIIKQIKHFLGDLDALGAKQLPSSRENYTGNLTELISHPGDPRNPKDPAIRQERPATQVVSGAGLIMAVTAIRFLPPFMNFQHLTVWVDDHLKRRLHEGLGDLSRDDVENVSSARIRQYRHPNGVKSKDVEWAIQNYFDRLLRGCVFRRTIVKNDGTPTDYTNLLSEIVKFKVVPGRGEWVPGQFPELRSRTDAGRQVQLAGIDGQMILDAEERYDEVLKCWSADELEGSLLWRWAKNRKLDQLDSRLFHEEDQLVPLLLAKRLFNPETRAQSWLREKCSEELDCLTRESVNDNLDILEVCDLRADELSALTRKLNRILEDETLWEEDAFSEGRSDELAKSFEMSPAAGKARVNRELLQWAFPKDIPWWNHRERICRAVVDDGLSYARLVYYWPIFVRAIERLRLVGNLWLYEPIDAALS